MPTLTQNRQKFIKMLTPEEVVDLDSWMEYAHQTLGVAIPNQKVKSGLHKVSKEFFELHPDATWLALVDVVRWGQTSRKTKHYDMIELLSSWKYAHEEGFMRILARMGTNDEETLHEMLKSVHDPFYADRMKVARTSTDRDEVYQEYLAVTDGGETPTYEDTTESFGHPGLKQGQVMRYRLSVADHPRMGTLLRQDGDKLVIYTGEREVALPPKLLQVKIDGNWEAL